MEDKPHTAFHKILIISGKCFSKHTFWVFLHFKCHYYFSRISRLKTLECMIYIARVRDLLYCYIYNDKIDCIHLSPSCDFYRMPISINYLNQQPLTSSIQLHVIQLLQYIAEMLWSWAHKSVKNYFQQKKTEHEIWCCEKSLFGFLHFMFRIKKKKTTVKGCQIHQNCYLVWHYKAHECTCSVYTDRWLRSPRLH